MTSYFTECAEFLPWYRPRPLDERVVRFFRATRLFHLFLAHFGHHRMLQQRNPLKINRLSDNEFTSHRTILRSLAWIVHRRKKPIGGWDVGKSGTEVYQ